MLSRIQSRLNLRKELKPNKLVRTDGPLSSLPGDFLQKKNRLIHKLKVKVGCPKSLRRLLR
jgi:hypothetical protein